MVFFLQFCEMIYLIGMILVIFDAEVPKNFFRKHQKFAGVFAILAIIGFIYMMIRLFTGQIF